MKFLVKATIDVATANDQMRRPGFGSKMQAAIEAVGAEQWYFAIEDGTRAIYFIVDVDLAERLPLIAEPLWLVMDASVEFIPLITPEQMSHVASEIHGWVDVADTSADQGGA